MIRVPPDIYPEISGIPLTALWSYGTINLSARFIKRTGKTVQGLSPHVKQVAGQLTSGSETYPFPLKTLHYVIIPLFDADGNKVSIKTASDTYLSTGQHLGVFNDKANAEKYSRQLNKAYIKWAKAKVDSSFQLDKELVDATFQLPSGTAFPWYAGNIDLFARPIVENADGSISTLLSISVLIDGQYVLIPRVVLKDGNPAVLSSDEAISHYQSTGQHLGKYATAREADNIAKKLSDQQNTYYSNFLKEPSDAVSSRAWKTVETLIKEGRGEPPFAGIIKLPDISDSTAQKYFQDNIMNVQVQYNMDLNSSITITVMDKDYLMMENNYFVPRRLVEYRGRSYEIADISCRPGSGGSPEVTIAICSRAIQQMKRDKKRGSVKGNSGYEYARNAAAKYNLGFIGQRTAKTKSQFSARSGNQEESVWDVITRTASTNQYVCFEVDGVLIYAQQQYLLWKFGLVEALVPISGISTSRKYTPLLYIPGNDGPISAAELANAGLSENSNILYSKHLVDRFGLRLETWPQFETSDNDPLAASGSCRVTMPNGGQLRPGHTVMVGPKPNYFFGGYLVSSVSFNEGSPESAQITFRTPEEPKKQNGKPINGRQGTSPVRQPAPSRIGYGKLNQLNKRIN